MCLVKGLSAQADIIAAQLMDVELVIAQAVRDASHAYQDVRQEQVVEHNQQQYHTVFLQQQAQ